MDRIFSIEFTRLSRLLTPVPLRKATLLAWLQVLVSAVAKLHQQFKRNRSNNLYMLAITPQVCYLEKMLNDRFDFGDRRIYISDPIGQDVWYAYQDAELKPEHMYQESEEQPVYTYSDNEAGVITTDFVVHVPASLNFNENEMKALLDMYKMAGKRYKIELE